MVTISLRQLTYTTDCEGDKIDASITGSASTVENNIGSDSHGSQQQHSLYQISLSLVSIHSSFAPARPEYFTFLP